MKKSFILVLILCMLFSFAYAEEVVSIEGGGWAIPATVTIPEGDDPFPLVIMFHGTGSNRDEAGGGYKMLAPLLAEQGIASVRFDFVGNGESKASYKHYTLTSAYRDGQRVLDYVLDNYNVDYDKIGVLGWSQGGTIAMLTAAWDIRIQSMVTWAGAVDLFDMNKDLYAQAEEKGFATREFGWREPLDISLAWFDEARDIDVPFELAYYTGATLAIAGEKDDVVPMDHMDAIVESVNSAIVENYVVAGADHTFNVFSDPDLVAYKDLAQKTVDFFVETLK